jgi:hypothetical protein
MTEQAQPHDSEPQDGSTPTEAPVTAAVTETPGAQPLVTGTPAIAAPLGSTTTPEPAVGPPPSSPLPSPLAGASAAFPTDRPEVAIGGAFAGGLVLALILKRLAR